MASRLLPAALAFAIAACTTPHRASLGEFEAALAAQDSATLALTRWCDARGIADPPSVRALPVVGGRDTMPPGLDVLLQTAPDEPLGYRHVRLTCGDTVLSEAHNWYVPGRLTVEMNHTLESTDTPFGKVVGSLGFVRERLESVRVPAPGCPQETNLAHRALLKLPDGRPISLVVECYTPANLAAQ